MNNAPTIIHASFTADCGHVIPELAEGHCGGTGYGIFSDRKLCYKCCDKEEVESLKDRSKPYTAYVSSDEKSITTWTGGKLMTITSLTKKPMRNTWSDKMVYIQAKDVHGNYWYGKGPGAGMYINMRPKKSA